jgi:hypothetical protein
LAQNGFINLIGVLSSGNVSKAFDTLMIKTGYMRGIMIGSRENLEDLNRALSLHKIHPVIDKVFSLMMLLMLIDISRALDVLAKL